MREEARVVPYYDCEARPERERKGAHANRCLPPSGFAFRNVAIWVSPEQDRTSRLMVVMLLFHVIALGFYRLCLH